MNVDRLLFLLILKEKYTKNQLTKILKQDFSSDRLGLISTLSKFNHEIAVIF